MKSYNVIFCFLILIAILTMLNCRSAEVQREIEEKERRERLEKEIIKELVKRFDYYETTAHLDNLDILIDDRSMREMVF